MMFRLASALTLALSFGAQTGLATEFWISPEAYRWPADETLRADLRTGRNFPGIPRDALPSNGGVLEIVTADGTTSSGLRGAGAYAFTADDLPEGLTVIVHEATSDVMVWDTWQSFSDFAERKGLGDVAAMQQERGLAQTAIREDCIRYAKSLVAVGHGRGADAPVGMRAEFVALANPYTDDLAGFLPVQLWIDGEPRRNVQVEVFLRPLAGGEARSEIFHTDGNGIVVLPVSPGTEYLVTSVTLEPAGAEQGGGEPEWRTLRASLTFEVPRREAEP